MVGEVEPSSWPALCCCWYYQPEVSGPRQQREQPHPEATAPSSSALHSTIAQGSSEGADFLDDAVAAPGELGPEEHEEKEELDLTWREGRIDIDCRTSQPFAAFRGNTVLHLSGKEYASPAQYFLRFLSETYIQEMVLNAINDYAASVLAIFMHVAYAEYLVWIALFIVMTTVRIDDHAAY